MMITLIVLLLVLAWITFFWVTEDGAAGQALTEAAAAMSSLHLPHL